MQFQKEHLCCREIDATKDDNTIADHLGLSLVCLNRLVLQTAYSQYRQQYGGYELLLHELHVVYHCVRILHYIAESTDTLLIN